MDKWLYFLKNLESFDAMPEILKEPIFQKAFHQAEIANFPPEERFAYWRSRMAYWENKGVIDFAVEEAVREAT